MTTPLLTEAPYYNNFVKEVTKHYSIEAIRNGLLLFFYKISCPTCQYAAPFINRFYKQNIVVLGVCQNLDNQDVLDFNLKFKLKFPSIIDLKGYPYSNSYEIRVVPTVFELDGNGLLITRIEAFHKFMYEQLFQRFINHPLFEPAESIVEFQPG